MDITKTTLAAPLFDFLLSSLGNGIPSPSTVPLLLRKYFTFLSKNKSFSFQVKSREKCHRKYRKKTSPLIRS
jgi:hypothetical protein